MRHGIVAGEKSRRSADPTRRAILARLASGEASVTELAKPLAEATGWLEGYRQFWESRFLSLDALLDEMKTKETKPGRTKR